MWTVVIVLAFPAIFSVAMFGLPALLVLLLTVGAAIGAEAGWQAARGERVTVRDGSAALTGLLLALNLPATSPWWMCLVGGVVAMIVGKAVFGGLGQNPFNPALTARVFLLIAFPVPMTQWVLPSTLEPEIPAEGRVSDLPTEVNALAGSTITYFEDGAAITDPATTVGEVDMITSASTLGIISESDNPGHVLSRLNLLSLFHGGHETGSLGEISALLLLLGGLILLWRRIITWHIPFSFLGTMALFALILAALDPSYAGPPIWYWPLFHLFAGGAMIGAWFMATDYVTSPMFPKGKIIFGVGCGLLTMIIRVWGGYPEGVSFAILLMNAAVPLIDRATKPHKFGLVRLAEEGS
jgi:electron transport complex protein RnfD